jgi:hypothetical protein
MQSSDIEMKIIEFLKKDYAFGPQDPPKLTRGFFPPCPRLTRAIADV